MKKVSIFLLVFVVLTTQSSGSIAIIPTTEPLLDIGYGVKITSQQFFTLTPKEYRKMTGHRLGLKKAIVLKVIQNKIKKTPYADGKNQLTAALLALLVGPLGIHRFYLGYTWQGIVQLLTLGVLGIWSLIDLIRIITGDLQPKDGEYAKTL